MESKVYTDMSPAQRSPRSFNGQVADLIEDLKDIVVSLLHEQKRLIGLGLPRGDYQRGLEKQIRDTSKAVIILKETLL